MPAPLTVHRADDRGTTRTGWLRSRHSFSFGRYRDPERVHVGPLRVLNDDRVEPGAGFGKHPHRDVEIVSYVLEGSMEHEDSGGHRGVVEADEVQFMRAGTGVVHSETNASDEDPLRFLQIWFMPHTSGLEPTYEKVRPDMPADGGWAAIVSGHDALPDGVEGDPIPIASEAAMVGAAPAAGTVLDYALPSDRQAYVFVVDGTFRLQAGAGSASKETAGGPGQAASGVRLEPRDAARITEGPIGLEAVEAGRVLLFDLASDDAVDVGR